jgi:hypothetical protein
MAFLFQGAGISAALSPAAGVFLLTPLLLRFRLLHIAFSLVFLNGLYVSLSAAGLLSLALGLSGRLACRNQFSARGPSCR